MPSCGKLVIISHSTASRSSTIILWHNVHYFPFCVKAFIISNPFGKMFVISIPAPWCSATHILRHKIGSFQSSSIMFIICNTMHNIHHHLPFCRIIFITSQLAEYESPSPILRRIVHQLPSFDIIFIISHFAAILSSCAILRHNVYQRKFYGFFFHRLPFCGLMFIIILRAA